MDEYSGMGEDFLEHHGVKGMKWGVRRDKGHEGEQVSTRALKKLDKKWDKENTGTAGFVKAHNATASKFNKETIHQINNKPAYKKAADDGTLTDFDHPTTKKYHKEIADKFADMMVESFVDLGMNPSGTKQYVIKKDGNGLNDAFLEPVSKDVKHADEEDERYKLTFHANGLLKSIATASIKHTIEFGEDFLEHYGVKGMKWGVRRDSSGALSGVPRSTNREARKDAQESARAKMFYGKGAGTRRKLINNSVDAKAKRDPAYKKAFDYHSEKQNLADHASKARGERKRKDTTESVAKTARGVKNLVMQNGAPVTVAAVAVYSASKNPAVRKVVKDMGDTTLNTVRSFQSKKAVNDWVKKQGF